MHDFNTTAQADPLPVLVNIVVASVRFKVKKKAGTVGTGRAKLVNAVFASAFILRCRLHF